MYWVSIVSHIIVRWILWLIIVVLCVGLFFLCSKISHFKKYKWQFLILLPVLIAIPLVILSIQGFIDISNESYITEYVEYHRFESLFGPTKYSGNVTASESVQITDTNGKTIILRGANDNFPYGNFSGTVTYAQRSRIILNFVAD